MLVCCGEQSTKVPVSGMNPFDCPWWVWLLAYMVFGLIVFTT